MPSLLDLGFKVFPVTAGAKTPPLISKWDERATSDPAQVRAWMRQYPKCNFGIHCEGMVVIDVDVKSGGPETLANLRSLWDLPPTLESETPTGGRHIFYKGATVPNGVNVLGPGIDIRSDHGYVIAPGSVISAGKYKWLNEGGISSAPAWLVKECGSSYQEKSDQRELPDGVSEDMARKRAEDFLRDRAPAVEGQGGDQWTYETICFLRDLGVSLEAIPEVISDWNSDCMPPWDLDDLYKKAENTYKYAQNNAGKGAVEADFSDVSHLPEMHREAADADMYRPGEIDLDAAIKTDYLVKGWLDRKRHAVLFGKWGAGKTFNAIHMAAHIAAGKSWFGQRVRQGSVLFLAYEGEAAMKKRFVALMAETSLHGWGWGSIPLYVRHMNYPVIAKRTPGQSTKPRGAGIIEHCLVDIKDSEGEYPALIIIDPLRNALGGSDSDVEYTQPYIEYTKWLEQKYGCAVLTIHHPGHGEGQRSRGDSGIEAAMDTVIRLDGDMYSMTSTKQRDTIKGTLYYNLRVVELGVDDDGDTITSCVVEQISDSETDPRLTVAQREFLDAITAHANEDGLIKKGDIRATGEMAANIRAEFVRLLCKKKFLIQDDKGYWLGGGPVDEMFS